MRKRGEPRKTGENRSHRTDWRARNWRDRTVTKDRRDMIDRSDRKAEEADIKKQKNIEEIGQTRQTTAIRQTGKSG